MNYRVVVLLLNSAAEENYSTIVANGSNVPAPRALNKCKSDKVNSKLISINSNLKIYIAILMKLYE